MCEHMPLPFPGACHGRSGPILDVASWAQEPGESRFNMAFELRPRCNVWHPWLLDAEVSETAPETEQQPECCAKGAGMELL